MRRGVSKHGGCARRRARRRARCGAGRGGWGQRRPRFSRHAPAGCHPQAAQAARWLNPKQPRPPAGCDPRAAQAVRWLSPPGSPGHPLVATAKRPRPPAPGHIQAARWQSAGCHPQAVRGVAAGLPEAPSGLAGRVSGARGEGRRAAAICHVSPRHRRSEVDELYVRRVGLGGVGGLGVGRGSEGTMRAEAGAEAGGCKETWVGKGSVLGGRRRVLGVPSEGCARVVGRGSCRAMPGQSHCEGWGGGAPPYTRQAYI